jgi:hypothetical protein
MPYTYYINGSTLLNSTSVFMDAELTICAVDGFYSDGVNSREQVNCLLLPPQVCATCAVACGNPITATENQGIFLIDLDLGSAIGAVIIRFNPQNIPDGIKVIYNSATYNKLSSPVDGYHQSTNVNNYTFIGRTSDDCGISGTTYPSLVEKEYDGSSFITTGNIQSVTVLAGDVSLGVASPGNCVMVIPKTSATPTLLQTVAVGPCSTTAWSIDIQCPILLTGYSSSTSPSGNLTTACAQSLDITYYNAPVTGTPGNPGIYDFVFSDQYGEFKLVKGWYKITGGVINVDNGIIIEVNTCP